jgi:hypothetical protein
MPNEKSFSQLQWPVASEQMIAAPAQEVWNAISRPGNLKLCHPFCASNPVQVWPGPDSRDEVHYLSGWVYERRFLRWHDGIGYDLEIGRRGGSTSSVSWRITPVDENSCVLRITVYPDILQNWPTAVRWTCFAFDQCSRNTWNLWSEDLSGMSCAVNRCHVINLAGIRGFRRGNQ